MRKRIKITGFSDWETMFYNNLLSIPVLAVFSVMAEDWSTDNLGRNLWVVSYFFPYFYTELPYQAPRRLGVFCYLPLRSREQRRLPFHTPRHGVFERQAVQHTGSSWYWSSRCTAAPWTNSSLQHGWRPKQAARSCIWHVILWRYCHLWICIGYWAGILCGVDICSGEE